MITRLACLLHDIGKLVQRTNPTISLSPYTKFLVEDRHGYSHIHAAYTAHFIGTMFPSNFQAMLDEASSHHVKNTYVRIADQMSASHDRKDSDADRILKNPSVDNPSILTTRLYSVFNEIQLENKKNVASFVPLQTLDEFCGFTKNGVERYVDALIEYRSIFKKLSKEIEKMGYNSYNKLYQRLYPRLKNHLFAVPANTYQTKFPTVGLFDHSKLTAAIATCLKFSNQKHEFVVLKYRVRHVSKFVYLDDDINRISLRSLDMALANHAIVFKILESFGLGYEHIFYSFGGQGRLLLPNQKNIEKKLEELNHLLQQFVNYRHGGITQLVLSYDIYDDIDLKNGIFYRSLKQDERNVLMNLDSRQEKIALQYDVLKHWTESPGNVFAYSFGKKEGELSLGELGSISKTNDLKEDCYYLSINSYQLGDTLYHNSIQKLSTYENLVMVKMDIVALSKVFRDGIQKESQSISKFMSISRYLELFFAKIVGEICKNEQLYLIYSGGDDIIFTCCKLDAVRIASRIVDAFHQYVGKNPSLNLSYRVEEIKNSYYTTYQKIKRTQT